MGLNLQHVLSYNPNSLSAHLAHKIKRAWIHSKLVFLLSRIVLFNIYKITFTYTRNIIDALIKSTVYTIAMIIICIDVVFNI